MSLWAWGANTCGQLGLGFASEQVSCPTQVDFDAIKPQGLNESVTLSSVSIPAISGGATETCVMVNFHHDSYKLMCFGATNHAEADGRDVNVESVIRATVFSSSTDFRALSSGWDFHLGLSKSNRVISWGGNAFGQLGRSGSELDLMIPAIEAKVVAAGLRHGAIVTVDGKLLLWGENKKSILGVGSKDAVVKQPTEAVFQGREMPTFVQVRCGKSFTIALDDLNRFWGCGTSKFHQLGRGQPDVQAFKLLDIGRIEGMISDYRCGWNHCIALLSNGSVIAWGRNNFCQLGNPRAASGIFRIISEIPETVTAVSCGSEHSVALGISGTVYAWGWNEHDNCGVRSNYSSHNRTSVPGENNSQTSGIFDCVDTPSVVPFPAEAGRVVQIACGYGNSFAVTNLHRNVGSANPNNAKQQEL